MLVKKELLTMPVCTYPAVKEKKGRHYDYAAGASQVRFPNSGKILCADLFKDGKLVLRFFSDGKSYIGYNPDDQSWNGRKVSSILGCWHGDVYSTEKDAKLVRKALNKGKESYCSGVLGELDRFIEHCNSSKAKKAYDRKYALMKSHFAMFPEYPKNLQHFCECHLFPWTYLFVSKIEKGSRTAVCAHCGSSFPVDRAVKPGMQGICPHCKTPGKYHADWFSSPKGNTARICICHRSQGNLLIRWVKVLRYFENKKEKYTYEDYYRNLYLEVNGKPVIYAYTQESVWPYGYDWFRRKNGYVNYESTYLYTSNLRQVFGRNYYHVDLAAELTKNHDRIDFASLLDNLKNIPQAEYFLRLGLYRIASTMDMELNLSKPIGNTFSEVLGVSKQYLPLYQKFNVSFGENRIIQNSHTWVSEESFLKMRTLRLSYWSMDVISKLLSMMSFKRFVNYFTKQKRQSKKADTDHLLTWYRDYLAMSEQLKVDLSRKSVRYPSDLKEAHDKLALRIAEIKNKVLDEQFRAAKEALYAGLKDYRTEEFQIVLPESRTDFIREGQTLNHCVGLDMYYQNHLKGERIFFSFEKSPRRTSPSSRWK